MNIETIGILIATQGSYEYKDKLKEKGFHWNSQKKQWQKKINMSNYQMEMDNLKYLKNKVKIQLEKKKK